MATVTVPPQASLLGIARELREKILKHTFKGSLVKINRGRLDITTAVQHGIILVCKQLHAEGQDLLIAATTLFVVYRPGWIKWMPVSVADVYLRKLQEVHVDVREGCNTGFDVRPLPSLKVLHVSDFDSYFGFVSRKAQGTLTIEKSEWFRILNGEIDEEAFITGWVRKAREHKREGEENPDPQYGSNTSWLLDILDNDVRTPFKLIIEGEETMFYNITDEVEADKKERAAIVVSGRALHAPGLFQSQALTHMTESTLRSQDG